MKSKKKRKQPSNSPDPMSKAEQVVEEATSMDSRYDPSGSYTGRPVDPSEHPTQDADDL